MAIKRDVVWPKAEGRLSALTPKKRTHVRGLLASTAYILPPEAGIELRNGSSANIQAED